MTKRSVSARVKDSLGPVVNILAIFSNANILKKIREKKYTGCPLLISTNIVIFDQGTEK